MTEEELYALRQRSLETIAKADEACSDYEERRQARLLEPAPMPEPVKPEPEQPVRAKPAPEYLTTKDLKVIGGFIGETQLEQRKAFEEKIQSLDATLRQEFRNSMAKSAADTLRVKVESGMTEVREHMLILRSENLALREQVQELREQMREMRFEHKRMASKANGAVVIYDHEQTQ